MSSDERLEMFQNSGVFIANRKVEEFLPLICLLSIARNLRISVVILRDYYKANTGFNSGFSTDFNSLM